MKAFYGLMLEEKKEERTYQFNAPIGVSFEEVKNVLDIFKSMIDEMDKKESEKRASEENVVDKELSDGTNS